MLNELMNVLGSSATAVDLAAALCLLTGVDPTLLPLSGTTGGRVLSSMGRLAAGGCGPIQTSTTTALTAVPAVPNCFESHVPEEMEMALTSAGVEPDVLASLYFDQTNGQAFRQRIKSKWRTFTDLVSKGLIQSPTGFFVSAVRKNWHLSSTYEPGKKKTPTVAPAGPSLPLPGAVVRVAGDLSRACRVISHRMSGGEWKTLLDDDGATLEVSARKLRAG